MKILVLTKRQYTGKDLLDDAYGRMWELPKGLGENGHEVKGICLSYRRRDDRLFHADQQRLKGRSPDWYSVNLGSVPAVGLSQFMRTTKSITREFHPDVIWASSDVIHLAAGAWFAKQIGAVFAADLYDNYESFTSTKALPGGARLLKRILRDADIITCVSEPLRTKVFRDYSPRGRVEVIENGVDVVQFRRRNANECRRHLHLPERSRIVGTAGALAHSRGISLLIDAYEQLRRHDGQLCLAVAGPRDRGLAWPKHGRFFDLGVLPHDQVAEFLCALNVAVVSNLESEFGRYCFPTKLYEILACRVPIAAASVGAVKNLLKDYPETLFDPGDAAGLAKVIRRQLDTPSSVRIPVPTWEELAVRLAKVLSECVR